MGSPEGRGSGPPTWMGGLGLPPPPTSKPKAVQPTQPPSARAGRGAGVRQRVLQVGLCVEEGDDGAVLHHAIAVRVFAALHDGQVGRGTGGAPAASPSRHRGGGGLERPHQTTDNAQHDTISENNVFNLDANFNSSRTMPFCWLWREDDKHF